MKVGDADIKQSSKRASFSAQVNCVCKRQCAIHIDVFRQRELFEEYHKLSWSQKTQFWRALVNRIKSEQKNVFSVPELKKKDFICSYFLRDDEDGMHQVCLSFSSKLFQVNRTRIFRVVASISRNPSGADHRGKFPSRKANLKT